MALVIKCFLAFGLGCLCASLALGLGVAFVAFLKVRSERRQDAAFLAFAILLSLLFIFFFLNGAFHFCDLGKFQFLKGQWTNIAAGVGVLIFLPFIFVVLPKRIRA